MLVAQKRAERESNVIYGFVSLANIFETAESKTTNRTNGMKERPPCNTLKSSFPLHTLKNEKCETRVTVRLDSNASVLSIFLRNPLAIYMTTVPLRCYKELLYVSEARLLFRENYKRPSRAREKRMDEDGA